MNTEDKVLQYFSVCKQIKELDQQKKDLLEDIARDCGFRPAEILGHKLKLVERKGNVDYKKLLAKYLPKVDVEPFRKAGTLFWQLT